MGCIVASCAQKGINGLREYEIAHNTHNVQRALSFYDDSISFEIKGVWTKNGLKEIRELELWDSTLNSRLEIEILNQKLDSFWCRVREENDWFKAAGIEYLIHEPVTFVVRKGKIHSIQVTSTQEANQKIGRVISSLFDWSQNNGDSSIYRLVSGNGFIYSPAAALQWIQLFEKAKTVKQTD
ncbi:MAG: hypothetical protein JPMHGGIA_00560 [Saprospiraceae bacterium]|nr:hypothetical protein [Saprospiraceae bacterium]